MKRSEFIKLFSVVVARTFVLVGKEALAAVTQDGYALRYVKEQSPEVVMAAVTQDGNALQYVNLDVFEED